MAGYFPDPPGHRIPYDRDGTIVHWSGNNTDWSLLGEGTVLDIADDSPYSAWRINDGVNRYISLFFPRPMDLSGLLVTHSKTDGQQKVWTSSDTTDGINGTWVSRANWSNTGQSDRHIREQIQSRTETDVRGLKLRVGTSGSGTSDGFLRNVHVYGVPTAGANQDRLQIVNVADEDRVPPAHFDYGDVARETTSIRQFRVKNLSPNYTAHDVIVAFGALNDTTPSVDGQHDISEDQTNYFAQVNIGDLAPGGVSAIMDLRQQVASDAKLALWWGRLTADAGSWS